MKFDCGDQVEIHSTMDALLDGQVCEVTGRSYTDPTMTVFIITLARPIVNTDGFLSRSITLTEHCLKAYP